MIIILLGNVNAQTCCSGGVPLSANLGLPPSDGKSLQVALSYDLNVLSTLKSGSTVLGDDSRSRRTHSLLWELGYNFNESFSVEGFFAWVRQDRDIQQFGNRNLTSTNGLGDPVFMIKYRALNLSKGKTSLFTAIGVKAPLGASDRKNDQGLPIIADLQPGSGAWDGILWMQFIHSLPSRPTLIFYTTGVVSLKGINRDYLINQSYQFGNELQIISGVSDRLLLGGSVLDPSLLLRFRTVASDRIDDQNLPSTGGRWFFLNPGLSLWLHPAASIGINGEVPLFSSVDGTQVSPTYRMNLGLYWHFALSRESNPERFVFP